MVTWLLIASYLLWITPIRLGVVFSWQSGNKPHFAAGALCWGMHLPKASARPRSASLSLPRILKGMKKSPLTRKLLRYALHVEQAEIIAQIGGRDAAWTALFSAGLQALLPCIPRIRCRVYPRLGGASAIKAGCIAEGRLGMLFLAALALMLSNRAAAKKEEQPWIIPSGN